MQAVIAKNGPGMTKQELSETLRREEVNRGLTFEYLPAHRRHQPQPRAVRLQVAKGDIMSLDSGGNYHGYIGDLCRMAIIGEPDAELEDLLGEIETIQRAAMKPIKAGARRRDLRRGRSRWCASRRTHEHMHFLGARHGAGQPRGAAADRHGPVAYDAYDADRPLEAGMVISVETTLQHPKRGFIKLEDTVAVTDNGFEIYGEGGRGWNRAGTAARS